MRGRGHQRQLRKNQLRENSSKNKSNQQTKLRNKRQTPKNIS